MKRDQHLPYAQRYMDDIACFSHDAARLMDVRERLNAWLWEKRRLTLKHPGRTPQRTDRIFDYLGYRVSRHQIVPSRAMLKRAGRKLLTRVVNADVESVARSAASYQGLVCWL
ncbi:MAG: hypothetical protein AAF493_17885 [Pseudomonadota bacterium]